MAYQVIARKWRPQRFADLVGQEHIAQTLKNAISSGRIAHAYLFVGPRGIGKTTSARIFAKALNCLRPVDGEPCCECSSCTAIASESSVDVIEIDAATHTQVEKAREICEEALHLPISSKFKIFIIDEVHMLSKQAWNALLKTIEEPPAHAKFIFATTEVNKVLPTVISRCQRFDLRRIPAKLISERLALIARTEGVKISPSAIDVIARAADGGMRDAQSLLDQLISFFGTDEANEISEEQALSLFGLTASADMERLITSIITADKASVILSLSSFSDNGKNLEVLFEEILSWLRGVMLCQLLRNPETVMEEGAEKIAIYKKLAAVAPQTTLQRLLEQLASTGYLLREAINKQVFIETILLKAMRIAHAVQIEDLIARLNVIRKTGELAALDAIPSLAQQPARPQIAVQAPQPAQIQAPPQQTAAPAPQPPRQESESVKKNDAPKPLEQTPAPAAAPAPEAPKPVPAPAPAPISAVPVAPPAVEAPKETAPAPKIEEPRQEQPAPVERKPEVQAQAAPAAAPQPQEQEEPEEDAEPPMAKSYPMEPKSPEQPPVQQPMPATQAEQTQQQSESEEEEDARERDSHERMQELKAQVSDNKFVQSALELFSGRIADIHG